MLFFNGSEPNKRAAAGVVLIDPNGEQVKYMVILDFEATNNMAEYEALIFGLTVVRSLGVPGQRRLPTHHQAGPWGVLLQQSPARSRPHPHEEAGEGLRCAGTATRSTRGQLSSGCTLREGINSGTRARGHLPKTAAEAFRPACRTGRRGRTSTSKLAVPAALHPWSPPRVVCTLEGPKDLGEPHPISQEGLDAWISEIRDYLKDNFLPEDQASAERIVRLAKRYAVVEGDLYRRGANGILMRCITREEGCDLLTEIHGGECGSHSSSRTLVGKAFLHGFYWPTALQDAAELVRSCKACQFHAK
jgi:hypothetical protein